jgi:hypothetical protein
MNYLRRVPAFVWLWAVGLQVLFALPYAAGLALCPSGARFGGFVYNPDDPYVYLSWMRQAASGHILFRNLFTLEPQKGLSFHTLFLMLGAVSHSTGLPLIAAYHGARLLCGIVLVLELWALVSRLEDSTIRRPWMLSFLCVGSGLGWAWFLFSSPIMGRASDFGLSTDIWMTETVPFLSMMLSPLFSAALCLIVGFFLLLLRAEETGKARWAVGAGLAGLVMGNIHSYDVLLVMPVWGIYLVALAVRARRGRDVWTDWRPTAAWLRFGVAIGLTCPSVAYQWWVLHAEPVFRDRANVPTLSPAPWLYLLGAGAVITVPLAVVYIRERGWTSCALWAVTWCAVAVLAPYVPLSFQRKLAIGLDIPFLLLGGGGLSILVEQVSRRRPGAGRVVGLVLVATGALTNLCFMSSVLQLLAANQNNVEPMAPLYVPDVEWNAMRWLKEHSRRQERVLSLPWMGNIIPSATGDAVFVGHWGETAGFASKYHTALSFFTGAMSPAAGGALLRDNRIDYVYYGEMEQATSERLGAGKPPDAPGLSLAYAGGAPPAVVYIYRVTR